MLVVVYWSLRYISNVMSTIPLVDYSEVKVGILALLYKSTHSFVDIFQAVKIDSNAAIYGI